VTKIFDSTLLQPARSVCVSLGAFLIEIMLLTKRGLITVAKFQLDYNDLSSLSFTVTITVKESQQSY